MAHEHEHGHPPGAGPAESQEGLDLAGQSLGDALRWSFRILTGIIVVLILFFFGRGAFRVPPDQQVLVLRFGEADTARVRTQGLHYAFPSPIDHVVRLSIQSRKLTVNTYWPRTTEMDRQDAAEKARQGEEVAESVVDAEGAYMLTGDLNIVEGRWDVVYNVKKDADSLVKYFKKVAIDESFAYNDPRRYTQERRLIRGVLQAAVVREISALPVTSIYPRKHATALPERIRAAMRRQLEELDCGIEISQVNLNEIRPPEKVKDAFDAVLQAVQEADQARIAAEQENKRVLISAAGEIGLELGPAINEWWNAREANDAARMAELEEKIQGLFAQAQGEVRSTLAEAETYREKIKDETASDAKSVSDLKDLSPDAVRLFLEDRHVATMQAVLEGCYEKFLVRPMEGSKSTMEIWLNRRPELLRGEKAALTRD